MSNSAAPLAGLPLPAATGTGNVLRLALAQALAGANSVVVYATGAVIGSRLAPDPALATLPISIFVVGMAACTLPAGRIARAHGRRTAFLAGTGCGVLVGLIAALAVVLSSFWIFCLATFFGGAYAAVVLSFRFAAADCVAPERRPRALSAVMAGGVFAGIIGPQLVSHTMDLWPAHAFAATFLGQAAVAALSAVVLMGVRLPGPTPADRSGGRPLSLIARQPRFVTAVLCGVVSYLLMNFLMTAAPLAMHLCGFTQADANLGLQWHVIAMYAPSFFTGRLIARFGAPAVVAAGLALTATAAIVGLSGLDLAISGPSWSCLASAGTSASSAPPPWCSTATGRRSGPGCSRSTTSWCSARWLWARSPPAGCSPITAGTWCCGCRSARSRWRSRRSRLRRRRDRPRQPSDHRRRAGSRLRFRAASSSS